MGNKSSLLLRPEEIAEIQEETGCKFNLCSYFNIKLFLKGKEDDALIS